MKKLIILIIGLLVAIACFSQTTDSKVKSEEEEQSCQEFNPGIWEDPSREPLRSEIEKLFGDLNGKTIVDIGAGAGYFAFEYAKKAEKVIATELDDRLINYMLSKQEDKGLDNVVIKKAHSNQAEFYNESIDYAFMVDVYHELKDPKKFLPRLKTNMNPSGKLVIVESHISPVIVTDYLEMAGFTSINVGTFSYNTNCGPVEATLITAINSSPRAN